MNYNAFQFVTKYYLLDDTQRTTPVTLNRRLRVTLAFEIFISYHLIQLVKFLKFWNNAIFYK